ncbi:MAG: dITP/XTP pyrophosphatase [Chlamydiales bacterium]|nr:dITP/XTP pyrophosphatase [Chlamydiales bacterium]
MDILIATTNGHKIREIRALLKPFQRFDTYSLLDFPGYQPAEETGHSFEDNALLKATKAAKTLKMWTIADDSGLVVPALGGAPGIYSSRFAGPNATDKENRKKLLKEMESLTGIARSAYFECCIVLATESGVKAVVKGACEGTILTQERGSCGFGYDPLFLKHSYNQTFAELEESVKNLVSHRAKALEKLKVSLERVG